jgi:hypothetical protein
MNNYAKERFQKELIKQVAYNASCVVISYYFPPLIPIIGLTISLNKIYDSYYNFY